jgi:2-polyprenyl-6-methoxyphenol hydroxylase-like FAD-dependent oxidoreductase
VTATDDSTTQVDHDVLIVGYGPVGQALGALLGGQGHDVAIVERFGRLYGLPRAIRLDGEAMRLLQKLALVSAVESEIAAPDSYKWFGADDELIVDIPIGTSPAGWREGYTFYQPALESALDALTRTRTRVDMLWAAQELMQHDDHVEVLVRRGREPSAGVWEPTDETRTIRARYVVGADGANSFVRQACAIPWVDLGFEEPWLVVDVRPDSMSDFAHLPSPAQYCDPRRPRVEVRNGSSHHRWEFMLLPDESPEEFREADAVWRLLEPHFRADQGSITRHAVYEFRSLIAERMHDQRVALAGDAAHLMPPFMGEGMCSGLRDAHNLAWRLDLLLRGIAGPDLLASYSSERRFQNEVTVGISIEMGKVSCTLDPAAARERDAAFRLGDVPPPPPLPGIGAGVRRGDADRLAGERGVQGALVTPTGSERFDDVVGYGFIVLCAAGDPRAILGPERVAFLDTLGTHLVTLDPSVPSAVADADGLLTAWLGQAGAEAVIVRPDWYVFASAAEAAELPALVDELRGALIS